MNPRVLAREAILLFWQPGGRLGVSVGGSMGSLGLGDGFPYSKYYVCGTFHTDSTGVPAGGDLILVGA